MAVNKNCYTIAFITQNALLQEVIPALNPVFILFTLIRSKGIDSRVGGVPVFVYGDDLPVVDIAVFYGYFHSIMRIGKRLFLSQKNFSSTSSNRFWYGLIYIITCLRIKVWIRIGDEKIFFLLNKNTVHLNL